ncbi:MAG: hypothetical protein JO033_12885 [Acidobacteriaceae bacterium]|nr:hypothetical protein [Acidobacteriaceae bacterium]MBV9500314.1 hypothetical protein [Acidobacteriaceae bacterium]
MDLRRYFRKMREVEAELTEQYPMVVSLETPDGGKPGLVSEVAREVAAKMIVEGKAALATETERDAYRKAQANSKAAAQKAELARRLQVAIVADPELHASLSPRKAGKPTDE